MSARGKRPNWFPLKVRLRNRTWPVHYVTDEHPELQEAGEDDDSTHNMGVCNIMKHAIYLDAGPDCGREQLIDTLVHELAHAFYCHSTMPEDDELEEQIVRFSTAFFLEMVRGVPAFWGEDE